MGFNSGFKGLIQIFLGNIVKCLGAGVAQSSMLRGERSGVRIQVGAEVFSVLQNVHTGSGAHPEGRGAGA